MKKNKATKKYLALYAEPEVHVAESLNWLNHYQNVLVIPALDETYEFITRLHELNDDEKDITDKFTLLILVINQTDIIDRNKENNYFHSNQNLHQKIHKNSALISTSGHLSLYDDGDIDILVIDRYSSNRRIPKKMGVGLARKIGADIAASLIEKKQVTSSFIFSSDADASLPKNYFSASQDFFRNNTTNETSALVFNFEHQPTDNKNEPSNHVYEATKIYEKLIKYYSSRLNGEGSPYGFCSLGSCLAITQKHYCQARGFPKKPAGEDFYLLNKISKLGKIQFLDQIIIQIEARLSNRVPFGTGPATTKILETLAAGQIPAYYDPRSFDCVGHIIKSISQLTTTKQLKIDFYRLLSRLCTNEEQSTAITNGLYDLGIDTFFIHINKQNIQIDNLLKTFNDWFDSFKTLKFIHYLTQHHYPKQAYSLFIT